MSDRSLRLERSWGTVTGVERGAGPTIVLLHPLAQSAELWEPVIDYLAPNFRVIALDARGHGESQWDESPFTVEDLAADVAAVLVELGIGSSAVLGMSMGGCTAMTLAAQHRDLVTRLVLVDTTSDYGPDKAEKWAERAVRALEVPRIDQLEFQVDRWYNPAFVEANPAEVERVNELFCSTSSEAHAAACRALSAFEFTDELSKVTAPTLIMVGEEDYAATVAMSEVLQRGIIESCLHVLPRTRHLSMIENRDSWSLLTAHLGAEGRTCPER